MDIHQAFIGISSHVIADYSIATHIPILTLINLRPFSHHICFPAPLLEGYLIFCISGLQEKGITYKISIEINGASHHLFTFVAGKTSFTPEAATKNLLDNDALIAGINEGWSTLAVPLNKLNLIIPSAGKYDVTQESNDVITKIGSIYFGKLNSPDLNEQKIEEIRRDPKLAKAIAFKLTCNNCKSVLRYHTSIDDKFVPPPESIEFSNLPDCYTCECGLHVYDMTDTKKDFNKYLGTHVHYSNSEYHANASLVSALESQRKVFLDLLNSELREEEYQKFLNNNPFFLTIFAPKSIYQKLSLLGQYTTDFVIVDSRHDLVLVEIEKPTTKLVLQDNSNHSELTHAIGQLHNWLNIVEEHKKALIETWNLHHVALNSVRGVVIAGRDFKYTEQQIKRMKTSNSTDKIKVYTYDDILRAVDVLIDSLKHP